METCEILITGQEWPSMPLLPHLRSKSGFSKSFTKVLLLKSRMHFSGKFCIPEITTSVVCNRSQSFASTHFTVNKYLNKRLKGRSCSTLLYSRSLHYYFLYPVYISLAFTVHCSRVRCGLSTDCFGNKTNMSSSL